MTYELTVVNVTGLNFITYDSATNELKVQTDDNQYGDVTYAVTLRATLTETSMTTVITETISFNVITTKDCQYNSLIVDDT